MYDAVNGKVDVVGIGVSTLDMFTVVDAFPRSREVQKASKMVLDGGGPVATAMVTLAKLGASTIMIDNLGDDWSGLLIAEEFKKYKVQTHCLEIFPQHSSSIANILVEKKTGIRAILYHPGTVPEIRDITKYIPIIQKAKVLHLNGRHFDASLAAIDVAKQAGVKISFDGGANRYNPNMRQIVPKVDICIVAKEFALTYTNQTKVECAGESLLEAGLKLVVITDGINGSWVFDNDIGIFHQPAFNMDRVIDTTGCGDSYHGGFLYGFLHNMSLKKCAEFASAVAALNTQALGGRKGLPSLKTVELFLMSH